MNQDKKLLEEARAGRDVTEARLKELSVNLAAARDEVAVAVKGREAVKGKLEALQVSFEACQEDLASEQKALIAQKEQLDIKEAFDSGSESGSLTTILGG